MSEEPTEHAGLDVAAVVRASSGLSELLVQLWLAAYKRRPRVTVSLTAVLLVTVVLVAIVQARQAAAERERLRAENLSYDRQVTRLADVEASLKGLTDFVNDERTRLRESQRVLEDLRQEKEKLEPVVQADRRAIEALLDLKASREAADAWAERAIGFVLGVLSSVLASFIYAALRARLTRREGSVA